MLMLKQTMDCRLMPQTRVLQHRMEILMDFGQTTIRPVVCVYQVDAPVLNNNIFALCSTQAKKVEN